MADAEVLTDLDRALTATETVVAGIGADQWAAPTPCTELDVRGVLNHVVRGNLLFVPLAKPHLSRCSREARHLAAAKVDYFWIANVIYLGFVLWAVAGSVLKLVAYRRGL